MRESEMIGIVRKLEETSKIHKKFIITLTAFSDNDTLSYF